MTITIYKPETDEQIPVQGVPALRALLSDGRVSLDDYCFYEGSPGWQLLRGLQITDNGFLPLPPPPPGSPPRAVDHSTTGRHNHTLDLGLTVHSKHNVLAYVTFALGCLSFLFSALAAIPGIICGRMALRQFDADPSLLGRSWAKVGLTLSYIILAVNLFILLGGILFYAVIFTWMRLSKP